MATNTAMRATLDDLMRVEGRAELIDGRIVRFMPTGRKPNRISLWISASLLEYEARIGKGETYTDSIGFAVPELRSGRESFSPDASYFWGPFPANEMKFLVGAPAFAAAVRSDYGYGVAADREIMVKRGDYFEAGTLAVWDVDPEVEEVRLYTRATPIEPETFRRGDVAHAEPALPGWRLEVDKIFGPVS
jgi:Uma2 family endonuclease